MQKEVLDNVRLVVALLSKGLVTDPSVDRLSQTDSKRLHDAIENLAQYNGADADVVAEILSGLKDADLPQPLKEKIDRAPVIAEAIKLLAEQGVAVRLPTAKDRTLETIPIATVTDTHEFAFNEGDRFTLDNRTMSRVTFEVRKDPSGQMVVIISILPAVE